MIASASTARTGRSAGRRGLIVAGASPGPWHLPLPVAVRSSGHTKPSRTAEATRERLEAPDDVTYASSRRASMSAPAARMRSSAAAGSARSAGPRRAHGRIRSSSASRGSRRSPPTSGRCRTTRSRTSRSTRLSVTYARRAGHTHALGAGTADVLDGEGERKRSRDHDLARCQGRLGRRRHERRRGARVHTDVSVAAKIPLLLELGVGLLVGGGLAAAGAIAAIAAGRRRAAGG